MNWIKETFSGPLGRWSSKRVCGGLGFFAAVLITIYCTVKVILAPSLTEALLFTSAGLLGADTVTEIWKKNG